MQTTGKLINASLDFNTGNMIATLELNTQSLDVLNELNNEKLDVEIKKQSKRRSLDCNAYMWLLIDKIAKKISTSEVIVTKEDIYKDAIRGIGEFEILPIKNEAVETFINAWNHNGVGWICENLGKSKLQGYTNIRAYYGSSIYDNKSMSKLVDLIIQECKQLNIETKSQAELNSLLKEWK